MTLVPRPAGMLTALRGLDKGRADVLLALRRRPRVPGRGAPARRRHGHDARAHLLRSPSRRLSRCAAGRRSRRWPSRTPCSSCSSATRAVGGPLGSVFAVILMNYSAGVNTDGRALPPARRSVVGVYVAFRLDPVEETAGDWLFGATMLLGGPLLVGRLLRSRSQLNRALRAKAARLERERAEAAEQAALDERARIASELMTSWPTPSAPWSCRGGRPAADPQDPAAAEAAYGTVEATGREALGSCAPARRAAQGGRRGRPRPQPSLAHLGDLARARGPPACRGTRRAGRAAAAGAGRRPDGLPGGAGGAGQRARAGGRREARVRIRYGQRRWRSPSTTTAAAPRAPARCPACGAPRAPRRRADGRRPARRRAPRPGAAAGGGGAMRRARPGARSTPSRRC